jgi:hypothetical protein
MHCRLNLAMSRVLSSLFPILALISAAAAPITPCDDFMTFADGKRPDREIYLAPTGSDSEGDGTREKPFRTLEFAARSARPGTALRLMPGTYPGGHSLARLSGTLDAPIWIGGIPGQPRPLISGGGSGLHLSRVRCLVIEHMELAGATGNGINCDDGGEYANPEATRHLVFRGLVIRDIGTGRNQDCLKLSGVNDYSVLDSQFLRGSAGGSGIDQVGCHRGEIGRCHFDAAGSNAIQCKGGSEDIEIRSCRFVSGGHRAINLGGSTGHEYFRPPLRADRPNAEARNIRVIANVFLGSDAPVAFVGCVHSLVANNTIIDPARWVIRILQETVSGGGYEFLPSSRSRFMNNLVSYQRSRISATVNIGPNTDPESFEFSNNLWYAADDPARSQPSLPLSETDGLTGVDPELLNAADGQPAVSETSPARGKGRPLPEVRADYRQRCYAPTPSIGAWEVAP